MTIITFIVASLAIATALLGLRPSFRILGARTELEVEIDGLVAEIGGEAEKILGAKERLLGRFAGLSTDINIGPSGIRVTSAATWMIVLMIAFVYIYLFITEVMEIREVNSGAPILS
ncbi:hypothetical protein [Paracoccus caeni]|uniref:hypothetical protein n=1 Tax=Paracoccus caeni TaxID=657651 RepID=UPI001F2B1E09|nr:hypothetical protein [Paracoccus caeni]